MAGLDGMEIYNRHFDAKKDAAGLLAIMLKLTAPASLRELEESLDRFPGRAIRSAGANTRPNISPSGTPKRRRTVSPALPPTTAITTTSCW